MVEHGIIFRKNCEKDLNFVAYQVIILDNNYSSSISSTSQTFNNSLLFLKTMAEKERAKEIAFLDAKVQELEKYHITETPEEAPIE